MLSLQIILTEKSLIIKLFSLTLVINKTKTQRLTEKTFTLKEGKRRLGECEIILIFRPKRENEVEAQRSEKLPLNQKCQSLFT